ncbi:protein-L-isoaspartate(D-aspartate) O-methyltransferase [Sedimenticola sp.]|uniref:protein-L-isoaspartate(D-aspartate) O-methyltransferase n=1 Tax=Sedimenticola sp. TaxID=1940285 RepID=UPI003D1252C0
MTRPHNPGMQQMLADIDSEVRYTRHMIGKSALDTRVMDAMARVPRDAFVPENMQAQAFDNGPLPIGHGQTISQPYIVALMTDLLAPQPGHRVLEIGTGSGYQTAVLSLLCQTVYSMERLSPLSDAATDRLQHLGYTNILTRSGNGYQGWPEYAPFNGILVTAAAPYIPNALIEQLTLGGHLVIPVGSPHLSQRLLLLEKDRQGHTQTRDILGVAFVPLVDSHAPPDAE